MIWFLDTNIVIACLRGTSPQAMRRLHEVAASEVRIALQVRAELLVGAARSANPARAKERVMGFLAPFGLVWPDSKVEDHYVSIRAHLESVGTPIGEADLWIAATARAIQGGVVTNNWREFDRVPDLHVVDWTKA